MSEQHTLKSIFVGQLFGRFDYQIDFASGPRKSSGITIITAPNGYGKSTILRLIDDLVRGSYYRLSRTAFRELVFQSSEDRGVLVEREIKASEIASLTVTLKFTNINGKSLTRLGQPWTIDISPTDSGETDDETGNARPSYMMIERLAERELGLRRVGIREWRDPSDGRSYSRENLMQLFDEHRSGSLRMRRQEPTWLNEFRSSLSVLYISANRLRVDLESQPQRRSRGGEMVEVISDRVLDQIRTFNGTYAETGRRLEQTFPSRVIEALGSRRLVDAPKVEQLVEQVRSKELKYEKLGLLGEGQTARAIKYPEDTSALMVLHTYLQDIDEKLAALEGPANRLTLFIETLNSMLLFKKLILVPDTGFRVVGDDRKAIPLRELSSGEQHLIVLLGELIFESTEYGAVLLDEPEISFHPEWQEAFPGVLAKIVAINRCMIVMATHSPTLIQDNWESVIELADQVPR